MLPPRPTCTTTCAPDTRIPPGSRASLSRGFCTPRAQLVRSSPCVCRPGIRACRLARTQYLASGIRACRAARTSFPVPGYRASYQHTTLPPACTRLPVARPHAAPACNRPPTPRSAYRSTEKPSSHAHPRQIRLPPAQETHDRFDSHHRRLSHPCQLHTCPQRPQLVQCYA